MRTFEMNESAAAASAGRTLFFSMLTSSILCSSLFRTAIASPTDAPAKPYLASADDFTAIQDGIAGTRKMAPQVFPNGIGDIDVVLYDSTNLYIWTRATYTLAKMGTWQGYSIYKVAHGGAPTEREMGRCGGTPQFILDTLRRGSRRFMFSCSPMGTQIKIQQRRGSIYDTRESYLSTILHEYGHQYMWQELWQIAEVRKLASIVKKTISDTSSGDVVEEAFAIWCELMGSRALYPSHYARLRRDFPKAGSKTAHLLGLKAAVQLLDSDA